MANTFNSSVNESSGYSFISYDGTIDLSGNLTDDHYTQAFKIGEANNSNGGFHAIASGGGGTNGDIQVHLEVSNDPTNDNGWYDAGQIVDLDADATSQSENQEVGSGNATEFNAFEWARIVAKGQASNDDDTVDWFFNLTKNDGAAFADNSTLVSGDVKDSAESTA